MSLKVLLLGDVNGKIGRKALNQELPRLKKGLGADLVIANAENVAHGSGVSVDTLNELVAAGVDAFTSGDHAFDKEKQAEECYRDFPIVRPANFPEEAPGQGWRIIKICNFNVILINLLGRVFMPGQYDCPFKKLDEILANINLAKENISAIIVDMHAEATSEKVALGHFADSRITALIGTHTHIPTADLRISESGMAYITDIGMVGADDSVLGLEKKAIIDSFITQIKHSHTIPEKGNAIINGVLLEIDPLSRRTISAQAVNERVVIEE